MISSLCRHPAQFSILRSMPFYTYQIEFSLTYENRYVLDIKILQKNCRIWYIQLYKQLSLH